METEHGCNTGTLADERASQQGTQTSAYTTAPHLDSTRKKILGHLADFGTSISRISKILNENPIIAAMRSPSPEADSAPLLLPSAERIEAALAAAKAKSSGLERELRETLATARTGDHDAINLFNVVAGSLLTNT